MVDYEFYKKKRVLITGNTGFKGAWLSQILLDADAEVTGYSLEPPTEPNLYNILNLKSDMETVVGDIRDYEKLETVIKEKKPEIVIHLAAQPIVRVSYSKVLETYETNVMGTVNLLESIRKCDTVKSVLNVTTDKVYENKEWCWGYRENDTLNGYDPYSNSKSCSELVTQSFRKSFFAKNNIAVSTARAGNVIGGGDFAVDRIVPDCVRAAMKKEKIHVRNPYSIRPYQHVLEALFAYLLLAEAQYNDENMQGEYNVGPEEDSCITTGKLVELFCAAWQDGLTWEHQNINSTLHEAGFLKLDCSKIKNTFQWNNTWDIEQSIGKTVEWSKEWLNNPQEIKKITQCQIREFYKQRKWR